MANTHPSKPPVIILAGGKGSRILEYTKAMPKPLIRVNRVPILIRIINYYLSYGFKDFIVATGYLHNVVEKYFSQRFKKKNFRYELIEGASLRLVYTGENTMTGGRILRLKKKLIQDNQKLFCLTYGDGVSDVNLNKLLEFHLRHKKIATVTTVRPPARFGYVKVRKNKVLEFGEKKNVDAGWINGGFFIFNIKIFDYIKNDLTFLEREPLEKLSLDNQLYAYKHKGFWQCMDTLRDKLFLDEFYKKN